MGDHEGALDAGSHTGALVTVVVGYRGAMLACKSYQHRYSGTHAKPRRWGGENTELGYLTFSHFLISFGRVPSDVRVEGMVNDIHCSVIMQVATVSMHIQVDKLNS